MERKEFYAKDRAAWRAWLQKNHKKETSLWLILYKKDSGVPSVTYPESVEEALCFGWIDSKPNKRDDKSYFLFFASRKPKSVWSKINKERIARLIKEGKMTSAGLEKIEIAKANGSWTSIDASEAYEMPKELAKAFAKSKTARKNFDAFPPGVKKTIYQWIESAKTVDTKTKRVVETVTLAAKNIRANQWRQPAKK